MNIDGEINKFKTVILMTLFNICVISKVLWSTSKPGNVAKSSPWLELESQHASLLFDNFQAVLKQHLLIITAAGIPDFRSPTSGLYNQLRGFDLPYPEAVFELEYFKKHPEPFFALAKELYPKSYKPTPCHYFIRLLHDKGLLLRHYTQNV